MHGKTISIFTLVPEYVRAQRELGAVLPQLKAILKDGGACVLLDALQHACIELAHDAIIDSRLNTELAREWDRCAEAILQASKKCDEIQG